MRIKSEEKINSILNCVNKYYEKNFSIPSLREIEKMTNISRQTASRYLKHLNETGIISYDGKNIITEQMKYVLRNNGTQIAVRGNIVCGNPLTEKESIWEHIYLPDHLLGEGHFFALYAYGDSMRNAGIEEKDLVIVRKQETANIGQIVVVLDEENCNTLKRLLHNGIRYYLHSENDNYEDLYPDEIKIQGIAVKVIKDIR